MEWSPVSSAGVGSEKAPGSNTFDPRWHGTLAAMGKEEAPGSQVAVASIGVTGTENVPGSNV